jgi:hypothetical protein
MKKILITTLVVLASIAHAEDLANSQKPFVTQVGTAGTLASTSVFFFARSIHHNNVSNRILQNNRIVRTNPTFADIRELEKWLGGEDLVKLQYVPGENVGPDSSIIKKSKDFKTTNSAKTFNQTEAFINSVESEGGHILNISYIPRMQAGFIEKYDKLSTKNFALSMVSMTAAMEESVIGVGAVGINSAASAASHLRMADVNEGSK